MSMLASSRTDSLTARFSPYIVELREFFASRNLPIGTPASLPLFLDHLRDPAFHEEMVSMVRSILYREEALPRIELMEIIAVAAAGPQALDDSDELRQPLKDILAFVYEVARSKPGFAQSAALGQNGGTLSAPEASPDAATIQPPVPAPASDALTIIDPPHFKLTNDHLSRSLLHLQTSPKEQDPVARTPLEETPGPVLTQPRAPKIQRTRPSLAAVLRRSYWIPGVIALLLAIAAVTLLNRHTTAFAPQTSVLTAPQQAKPNPYIDAQPNRRPSHHLIPSTDTPLSGQSAPPPPLPERVPRTQPPTRTGLSDHEIPPPIRSASKRSPGPTYPATSDPLAPREGVFLASSGAMASHLLSAPAPGYPKLASLTRTQGQVIVQVVVGRDGKVSATRVLDGPHLLRSAAEHAIHKWRYRPYLVDGRPTDVATIVTVSFRLR